MLSSQEIDVNRKKTIDLLLSTGREGVDGLIGWFESEGFFKSPASTMYHGNYAGGLAAHSLLVYEGFAKRVGEYGLAVPDESAVIAGICHDACKNGLYVENILRSGFVSESKPYKVEDSFPIGHGEKSVIQLSRHIELTDQEAMIIRWHMGENDPAYKDYKEKVERQFPEVVVFQNVDKEVSMLRGV